MQHLISGAGVILAATSSGSGKTVLTLALLRAMKRKRLFVRGAKAGPDFIDPAFHTLASGRTAFNLDPWGMSRERLLSLVATGAREALLIEAMMGLFDGAADGTGSAADLAEMLDLPVVLVVDCAKQSHSVAALVRGFRDHRPSVKIGGVILNKVGSERHEAMLRSALEPLSIPILGAVRRDDKLELPERHLGLVQAGEIEEIDAFLEGAADIVAGSVDLEAFAGIFQALPKSEDLNPVRITPPGHRIAIARDAAFSFLYSHLIMDWRLQGASLHFFSPLADEAPDVDADAVFLPGGYPELYCEQLVGATKFQKGMIDAAERGAIIHGECGGYMVLGEVLTDAQGKDWPMLGLLKLRTSFAKRKLHLGYRRIEGLGGWLKGQTFSAHEFHYTSALEEDGQTLFHASDALGNDLGKHGLRNGSVSGSYMHLIDRIPA